MDKYSHRIWRAPAIVFVETLAVLISWYPKSSKLFLMPGDQVGTAVLVALVSIFLIQIVLSSIDSGLGLFVEVNFLSSLSGLIIICGLIWKIRNGEAYLFQEVGDWRLVPVGLLAFFVSLRARGAIVAQRLNMRLALQKNYFE